MENKERMRKLCKKEGVMALFAFIVVTALTHIYPLYFLFPGMTETFLFGFPTHYLLAMILSWLVLLPFYWWYVVASDRLEQEIEETSTRSLELQEMGGASAKAGAE